MKRCIVPLDQSMYATNVFLLDEQGTIIRRFSKAHEQFYPAPGHVEQDADILEAVSKDFDSAVTRNFADVAHLSTIC